LSGWINKRYFDLRYFTKSTTNIKTLFYLYAVFCSCRFLSPTWPILGQVSETCLRRLIFDPIMCFHVYSTQNTFWINIFNSQLAFLSQVAFSNFQLAFLTQLAISTSNWRFQPNWRFPSSTGVFHLNWRIAQLAIVNWRFPNWRFPNWRFQLSQIISYFHNK